MESNGGIEHFHQSGRIEGTLQNVKQKWILEKNRLSVQMYMQNLVLQIC